MSNQRRESSLRLAVGRHAGRPERRHALLKREEAPRYKHLSRTVDTGVVCLCHKDAEHVEHREGTVRARQHQTLHQSLAGAQGVPDIRVYFFGCKPVDKNSCWSLSTCKEEEVFSLVKVIAPLRKTLLKQGSVRTIPIHAGDIPHTHRAFLDRYFSGTHVACFSQSSLLEHSLLLSIMSYP